VSKPQLTVYTRDGCHLCEALLEELDLFCSENAFSYQKVEISTDNQLEARYGTKVPVVEYQGNTLCEYFLDADAIKLYFGKEIN